MIGALGGFATPLLVSTGSDNARALFAYYLVLDVGIAAVAWYRTWRSLNLVGFVATFLVATAWGVLRYRPRVVRDGQAFLIAFFLLFVLIMLLPARRAGGGAPTRAAATPGSTARCCSACRRSSSRCSTAWCAHIEYGVALSALVLAAFYVVLAA